MLTAQQARLFRFIQRTIVQQGFAPSQFEMMIEISLSSVGQVRRHLVRLENVGLIRRLKGQRERGIELAEPPLLSAVIDNIGALPEPKTKAAKAERERIVALLRLKAEIFITGGRPC